MATRGHGISNVAPAAEVKFMHQLVAADQYWKTWQAELFLNLSIFDDVPCSVCHRTMCNLGLTNVLFCFLVIQGAACSRMHLSCGSALKKHRLSFVGSQNLAN
jgi:hypothetical protein